MNASSVSVESSVGKSACPRRLKRGIGLRSAPADHTPPTDALLRRKYQHLTRKHLGSLFDRLFSKYTGLHFHVAWVPPGAQEWDGGSQPTGCSVCCQLAGTSLGAQPMCRTCGPLRLARALRAGEEGYYFKCHLGVLNYWVPLRVREITMGLAYLQALDGDGKHAAGPPPADNGGTKTMSRSEFHWAGRLLQLIIQHVQTLDVAELRKGDLTNAGRAVMALEREQARLREALQRHLPASPPISCRPGAESRPEQTVHRLLECIEREYAKPMTLREYARKLGMNVAYLSALFSRAVGLPFKAYLTEVRLQKAEELLHDPTRLVSDVAYAVGYASDNRFRIAFKKATGLSPRTWRETLRLRGPALGACLLGQTEVLDGLRSILLF